MSLKSHRQEDPNGYNVDLHTCSKEMGIQLVAIWNLTTRWPRILHVDLL